MPVPVPVPLPLPAPPLLPPEMQARVQVQLQMQLRLPSPPAQQYPPTPDAYHDNMRPMSPAATPSGNQVALAPALPPAAAVNLLNNLLVFYQHERNWVHRTRASIELALVQRPLVVVPKIGSPRQLPVASSSSSSLNSGDMSGSTLTNDPTPSDEDREMDIVKKEEESDDDMQLRVDAGPLTLRATKRTRAPASRWLKRKKSYKLHLGPLSATKPGESSRSRCRPTGEVDPGTQLLALFGELVDARMESCLRITQLIRNSNRSMLHS